MGRLMERTAVARTALATLQELPLDGTPTKVQRDAAIQRFEYSFEVVWKAVQQFLREVEGVDPGSPKGTVRASLQVGLLDEVDARTALEMVDDRNLTVYTYNEALAERIFSRLNAYAAIMVCWLDAMERRARGV